MAAVAHCATDDMHKLCQHMKEQTNTILKELITLKASSNLGAEWEFAAINWADLKCVSVQWWIDEDEDSGYRVLIEEANSVVLNNYVRAELLKRYNSPLTANLEVTTEW